MQSKTYEMEVGGKKMVAEFTDLAEQASGSVICATATPRSLQQPL